MDRRRNETDIPLAIIGFGALAKFIIDAINGDSAVRISHVLVRPQRKSEVQRLLPSGIAAISSLDDLDQKPALIVELASHSAVATIVPKAVNNGLDVVIASTGALVDVKLHDTLTENARLSGSQIHVLPGAIGAVDVLGAHRQAGLESVSYTGRKAPMAWEGTPASRNVDLQQLRSAITIFEGSARESAKLYPKNANVAATIALAGMGFDDTRVRLIADPHALATRHSVIAESKIGRFEIEMFSRPLAENPKTSALTAYSVLRFLRNLHRPIVI